jgi:Peptidase family M48
MRILKSYLAWLMIGLASVVPALAQDSSSAAPPASAPSADVATHSQPASFNAAVDRVIARERQLLDQMRHMRPMVETYLQYLKDDKNGDTAPVKDTYFLGRMAMSQGPEDVSFMGKPGFGHRMMNELTNVYSMRFLPLGFAQMAVLDNDFQKKYYDFSFRRREFLGEVRCLVIDVHPKKHVPAGRFIGRIWVEDQDYNIVRFNGTYYPQPRVGAYLHFDSWRLNLRPGIWLPSYIYSEESDIRTGLTKSTHLKGQTRLWGYDLSGLEKDSEFTQIVVDSPDAVKDQSDTQTDASPVIAERFWERQAEDNAIERMQNIGLLAPPGEVDKVLATVVNNLLVTNNIDLGSEVRCRVLLTAPLESFTIGRTIVVSRGLIDVLPDEASLAMVLAHELGHIVLGHRLDTMLAFNDRLFFPDEKSFQHLDFRRSVTEEKDADAKAVELLQKSPYNDKLANAGLFLRALQLRSPDLPNLITPHLGNSFSAGKETRMSTLLASAPALEEKRIDQIAALPLGGRVKVDPWSDQAELVKAKPVALTSPREKMPFQVTPFFPYLTRLGSGTEKEKVAVTAPTAVPAQK